MGREGKGGRGERGVIPPGVHLPFLQVNSREHKES